MTPEHGRPAAPGLEPWVPDVASAPPPAEAPPDAFTVAADDGTRIHFLDWAGPAAPDGPAVLLLPGLLQSAWTWAGVARRLAVRRRVVVADLRGQGLSDAPMTGYDLPSLAGDVLAAAEGAGLLAAEGSGRLALAGLGFGAVVAAAAARALESRCAGLVLVDGGWERLDTVTGLDLDEFLRGFDEPPEVMRSMDAWLADRRAFDPATWDADQEHAARNDVVETAAGHVVRAVRPHVVASLAGTMFAWDPVAPDGLPGVEAPVTALVALGAGDPESRLAELRRTAGAMAAAGRRPVRVTGFPGLGHNLARHRPADVAAAVLEAPG